MIYRWRKLTDAERTQLLASRKASHRPWHSPLHRQGEYLYYHVTAACFEHRQIIGESFERMRTFEETLLQTLEQHSKQVVAWCVLPNHDHAAVDTKNIPAVLKDIGRMHGRTSFDWNGQEKCRGRQVWFNCVERALRNERHFWATVNYIHHNPVHHGYVEHCQDWPFSSGARFLKSIGRERAAEIWRSYPILNYGKGWDDAKL